MEELNDLVESFSDYEITPKAVYAAVICCLMVQLHGTGKTEDIEQYVREEWDRLYSRGVVPQKRPDKS